MAEARAALPASPPAASSHRETLNEFPSFRTSPASPSREPAPRVVPQPESQKSYAPPVLIQILLAPFSILTKIVGGSFSLIGYMLSFIPRLLPGLFITRPSPRIRSGRRPLSPRDTAARFARELEEDYGSHQLHFFEGGYSQAYDLAKKDLKFLLVILISPEHDDTASFVQETLLAPEVAEFLDSNASELLVWGGNVQDSEAYEVSNSLNCSKFPFAALVAHTPQDSSTSISTIARISGGVTPSALVAQIRRAMEQQSPVLTRSRAQRNEQQATRSLRDEQNSAYERSLAQDRERARQRREAEAQQANAAQAARTREEAAKRQAQKREHWRKWRAQSLRPEPGAEAVDTTRISIRMTSGERVLRKFDAQADVEELYAFVECYDLVGANDGATQPKPDDYKHSYRFRLISPMPRTVYDVESGGSIAGRIGKSGNLLVESADDDDSDS